MLLRNGCGPQEFRLEELQPAGGEPFVHPSAQKADNVQLLDDILRQFGRALARDVAQASLLRQRPQQAITRGGPRDDSTDGKAGF